MNEPLPDEIANLWDRHFAGDEWPPLMHKRFAFARELLALQQPTCKHLWPVKSCAWCNQTERSASKPEAAIEDRAGPPYADEPAQDAVLSTFKNAGFRYDGQSLWEASLYTDELLALAVALARTQRFRHADGSGEKREVGKPESL